MTRRSNARPKITVTQDSDGGVTLHDSQSGVSLSVIGTHPDANGPKGLFVEAYAYRGGPLLWQAASPATAEAMTVDPDKPVHHPTIAFYAPEGD